MGGRYCFICTLTMDIIGAVVVEVEVELICHHVQVVAEWRLSPHLNTAEM